MTAPVKARLLGGVVALAGVLDLVSAFTPEWRSRLDLVRETLTPEAMHAAAGTAALIGLALLAIGRGIARRRRAAYHVTLVLLVIASIAHVVKGFDFEEAASSLLVAALLVWQRRLFCVRLERARLRTIALAAFLLIIAYAAYGSVGIVWHRTTIDNLTLANGAREIAGRFVGVGGPLGFHNAFGQWFPPSLTVLAIGGILVLVGLVLAPMAEDLVFHTTYEDIEALVSRRDGDTLDPFALRNGKRFELSPDGRAAVAYRLVNGVALASGDPVGDPAAHESAWVRFLERCNQRGWRPAVIAAREDRLPMYERSGFRWYYIGDEAVIDVAAFGLAGRAMRPVRQAVSRTGNFGCTTEIHREGDLDPTLRRALRGISDGWRAGAPERGFSMALGDLLTGTRPGCLIVVTRDRDGAPIAFQRYVPCRGGMGLSLDAMRRDLHAPNGVNERMIVDVVGWAREHDVEVVSLNFAAFREVLLDDEDHGPVDATQAWVLRRLGQHFQIESLLSFNSKFHPRWVKRYLVCRTAADFLPVGIAALNAEAFLPFDRTRTEAERSGSLNGSESDLWVQGIDDAAAVAQSSG